jgi:hypothetical protein
MLLNKTSTRRSRQLILPSLQAPPTKGALLFVNLLTVRAVAWWEPPPPALRATSPNVAALPGEETGRNRPLRPFGPPPPTSLPSWGRKRVGTAPLGVTHQLDTTSLDVELRPPEGGNTLLLPQQSVGGENAPLGLRPRGKGNTNDPVGRHRPPGSATRHTDPERRLAPDGVMPDDRRRGTPPLRVDTTRLERLSVQILRE